MKERFCWNCKLEKKCQENGIETDSDHGICGLHKFVGEGKKKSKSPTKKKGLTKQNKFDIMMLEIAKAFKSFHKK